MSGLRDHLTPAEQRAWDKMMRQLGLTTPEAEEILRDYIFQIAQWGVDLASKGMQPGKYSESALAIAPKNFSVLDKLRMEVIRRRNEPELPLLLEDHGSKALEGLPTDRIVRTPGRATLGVIEGGIRELKGG